MSARSRHRPWYRSDCPSARDHVEVDCWPFYSPRDPWSYCAFCGRVPVRLTVHGIFGLPRLNSITLYCLVAAVYPLPPRVLTDWQLADPPLDPQTETFLRLAVLYRMGQQVEWLPNDGPLSTSTETPELPGPKGPLH